MLGTWRTKSTERTRMRGARGHGGATGGYIDPSKAIDPPNGKKINRAKAKPNTTPDIVVPKANVNPEGAKKGKEGEIILEVPKTEKPKLTKEERRARLEAAGISLPWK